MGFARPDARFTRPIDRHVVGSSAQKLRRAGRRAVTIAVRAGDAAGHDWAGPEFWPRDRSPLAGVRSRENRLRRVHADARLSPEQEREDAPTGRELLSAGCGLGCWLISIESRTRIT
jgi:hypothetical protein